MIDTLRSTVARQIDLFAPRGRGGHYPSIADQIDASGDCWQWTGCTTAAGYGTTSVYGVRKLAHRVVWEALVGPIPEGLVTDHLCRNKPCVNPDHLEMVAQKENVLRGNGIPAKNARKTHCPNGHPYSGSNLYVNEKRKRRECRQCWRVPYRKQCPRKGLST